MYIKNNLRLLMFENNMTIRDVHKATGLSEVTISKLYHRKSNTIAFETISKLCVLLNCKIGDLLYVDDNSR